MQPLSPCFRAQSPLNTAPSPTMGCLCNQDATVVGRHPNERKGDVVLKLLAVGGGAQEEEEEGSQVAIAIKGAIL